MTVPFVKLISVGSLVVASTLLTLPSLAEAQPPQATASSTACTAATATVFQRDNPETQANVFTTSAREAASFAAAGFSSDKGTPFRVSTITGPGLQPVHRLYRRRNGDYLFTASPTELTSAQRRFGYLDQGVEFYVSRAASACLVPVYRFRDGGQHRLVATAAGRDALAVAGASAEGIAFYAAPTAPVDTSTDASVFTLAVIPPTQQEVLRAGDSRWANRTAWLAKNKDDLNLRFVTGTGDVVNWGNVDHQQFQRVQSALGTLTEAGIPYSLAVGNHDTAAVCPGGSACDPSRTTQLFRNTTAFNSYFDATGFGDVGGEFEPGKVDNSYSRFTAGGRNWMVLTLEMWPRRAAVAWAKQVAASHPGDNIVVVTHQYLTSSGTIDTKAGYGQTSPRYLYDHLISRYPNIKLVFNGHDGYAAYRTDPGANGTTVYSFGVHMHSDTTNPIQLVTIDARKGTLSARVYAPYTDETLPGLTRTVKNIAWR